MQYQFDLWSGDKKMAIFCAVDREEALATARRWAASYPPERLIRIVENLENDYFETRESNRRLLHEARAARRMLMH